MQNMATTKNKLLYQGYKQMKNDSLYEKCKQTINYSSLTKHHSNKQFAILYQNLHNHIVCSRIPKILFLINSNLKGESPHLYDYSVSVNVKWWHLEFTQQQPGQAALDVISSFSTAECQALNTALQIPGGTQHTGLPIQRGEEGRQVNPDLQQSLDKPEWAGGDSE